MAERFTDRAQRAVALAHEEARLLGHGIDDPRSSLDQRLTDLELALQPLPELLARITRSLEAAVAGVEALERRLA